MSSSSSDNEDAQNSERICIREDLRSMTFEELLNLKKELGAKVYNEAVLGVDVSKKRKSKSKDTKEQFQRLNKNRPREVSSKRQVPFLGAELRSRKEDKEVCDPRFNEKSGTYDAKSFKENYQFISKIREKEIEELNKQLNKTTDDDKRKEIKCAIQRLKNKNMEDEKWHKQQSMLKQEKLDIQKALAEGKQPHYVTKKERRTKELVQKFEELKKTGKLSKHLEKRRKKNVAKDRKKINLG